jgi:hypothetical protein
MPTPLAEPPPEDELLLPPELELELDLPSSVVLLPHAVAVSASAAETTPAAAILDTRRKGVPFGHGAPVRRWLRGSLTRVDVR